MVLGQKKTKIIEKLAISQLTILRQNVKCWYLPICDSTIKYLGCKLRNFTKKN